MVQEVLESQSAAGECTEEVILQAYPDLTFFPKFVPLVSAGGMMDLWSHLVQLFHVLQTKGVYVFIPHAFFGMSLTTFLILQLEVTYGKVSTF